MENSEEPPLEGDLELRLRELEKWRRKVEHDSLIPRIKRWIKLFLFNRPY